MFWLGKLLGALFGYMIAGPFGAIFGLVVGHYFDLSHKGHWFMFPPPRQDQTQTQEIFFKSTFTIMGYIAKSDGRVSENEIRAATRIMQNMLLTPHLKQKAIHYFRLGKQSDFNLDQMVATLSQACFNQPNLLQFFLELQMQAAYADGSLSKNKQRILEYICYRLNVDSKPFFQRYYHFGNTRGNQYQYRQQGGFQQKTSTIGLLDKAYKTLGVNAATNNGDLKRAYRKLMSKNHPDKLISKGLPEEMLKLATQKTQEIKLAYETICKARGI